MASSHQQGNSHLKFVSISPYFFKIILQDTIQNGKLGIPRKFVKNHGNSMSSPAMLSVPSGAVWKVELTKSDGKIWLENGWLEFSNHYSLDIGHLLVFRYDGNSNFHVVIFDKSASEIQYPYNSNNHSRSNEILKLNINESEDDGSIQILENIYPSRKTIEKSQSPCPRSIRMMKSTDSAMKTECNLKSDQQFGHNGKGNKSRSHSRIQRLKALERASNTFKSENPFFLVVMYPSYVGCCHVKKCRLTIPTGFVREHLMKEHRSVTLCNSSWKTWIANFKQSQIGKNQYSYLQTGWGTFVRDNNIQVNDVCSFELINSTEISFKVVIYKGQHANCHQILASEIQYTYTRDNHSQTDEIPEQNIEESEDDDTIEILEVISPSGKIRKERQSPCPLSHKMMRSTNSAIKTETECNGIKGDKRTSHHTIRQLKTQEKFKALERVRNTFKSENPFFLLVIQPSYVALGHTENFRLAIPCNFVKEHLMKKHCSVILCNSSGKTWIATFKQRKTGKKLNSYLIAGWGTFARDNNIQVGDVCAFELINSIDVSFKVIIYQGQHANGHQSLAATDVFHLVKQKTPSCASQSSSEPPVKHKAPSYANQGCPEPWTALEKAKAFQMAGGFKSENPFFVVVLQPSYVRGNKLSVPMNFARKYLTMMQTKVIHLLSDGNSWPVMYDQRSERSYAFLCSGWHRFAVDNNLEVGDVCVFELSVGTETSMKVTIYKKQAIED